MTFASPKQLQTLSEDLGTKTSQKRNIGARSLEQCDSFHPTSNIGHLGMGQNPGTPVVHIKIAGLKWMFIPLKMVFS
jgi:hypothetical protein